MLQTHRGTLSHATTSLSTTHDIRAGTSWITLTALVVLAAVVLQFWT